MKIKKDLLLSELQAARDVVKAADLAALAEHRARNKEVAKARREWMRAKLRLSDDKLAELRATGYRSDDADTFPAATSCPIARLPQLDRLIKSITMDMRTLFTIELSDRDHIGQWLTFGESECQVVC